MKNVFNYLEDYGNLTFAQLPFNEADSLILSLISYVDFDGVTGGPDEERYVSLKELSETCEKTENHFPAKSFLSKDVILFQEAARTKRFGLIGAGRYVNRIDVKIAEQFSATTFLLGDSVAYVAYRGTDATIIGWKEDFNMSFCPEIPAQGEAVKYLEGLPPGPSIRIGGHSKGGNLAIYASVKCSLAIRNRILSVDSFDGPGFKEEFLQSKEYAEMIPKITKYLPQSSLIGIILKHTGTRKIVKSHKIGGIQQHDAFNWEVEGNHFIYLNELHKSSELLESIIMKWVEKLDRKQLELFFEAVFTVLESTGIKNTIAFKKQVRNNIKQFITSTRSLPKEVRRNFFNVLSAFYLESRNIVKVELIDKIKPFHHWNDKGLKG